MAAAAGTLSSTAENDDSTVIAGEFAWVVPVFNPLTTRELESPVFEGAGQRWRAKLDRWGRPLSGYYFSASLKWLGVVVPTSGDNSPTPPVVRYKIVKLTSDGEYRLEESKWITARRMEEFERRNNEGFYVDEDNRQAGVLQLRFEVAAKKQGSTSTVLPESKAQGHTALSGSLRTLLDSGELADLEVVVDFPGEAVQKLKAHRAILAARSDVFSAMFQEGTASRELLEGRLVVEDIRPEVFHRLLEYIYTGQTEKGLKECAADLMVAADKYQLLELKSLCAHHLATMPSQITVENAGELLELAWKQETGELKRAVLRFINQHKAEVVATEGWKEMKKNPALMFDLLECYAVVIPEEWVE